MSQWMLKEFRGDKETGFEHPLSGSETDIRKLLELLQARHLNNHEILNSLGGATNHLTVSPINGSQGSGLMTSGTDFYYVATKESGD